MTGNSDDYGQTDAEENVCEACRGSFESEEALDRHVRVVGVVE